MKDFKKRHGSKLYEGTDARDTKSMIEKKKARMLQKANMIKDKNRKGPMGQHGREFSKKAANKIVQRSRPTRSKVIVKG